ncbi:MAG: reverse transcriptase-like protein [candidate division Zixibacteria bacterium]|nr:reverse transcriptase-like protein [candidate division Zixibacteria bacterium]
MPDEVLMKLYFFGRTYARPGLAGGTGIISIMLPDLGVLYRTQFAGTQAECEYTAALMALKFVENNKSVFKNQKLELLSDSAELVENVNSITMLPPNLKVYRDSVLIYLKKFDIKLSWVPMAENRAAQHLPQIPPLKNKLNLQFDFGQKGRDSALIDGIPGKSVFPAK